MDFVITNNQINYAVGLQLYFGFFIVWIHHLGISSKWGSGGGELGGCVWKTKKKLQELLK